MFQNSLERGRIELGLTRPQALVLIGAKPGRGSLLATKEDMVDEAFAVRMALAVKAYREWTSGLLQALEVRNYEGRSSLKMQELSELTGVRETNLTALRSRGFLDGELVGNEYVYSTDSVRRFIRSNSFVLLGGLRKARGPLANAFLRWYAIHHRELSGQSVLTTAR